MTRPIIGIIGGSGIYDLPGLEEVSHQELETPFGAPSDPFLLGKLGEQELVFISRHGAGHRLNPSEVNARANIWGLKKLGCTRVISLSAVGSMREEIEPGQLVLVDQFIDRTFARKKTFFEGGIAAHVAFANPVCPQLHAHLRHAAFAAGATVHEKGTYLCMEGPQFSTRAESLLYRSWNMDVIGMTAMPEAKLAREAELCYATVALATDYDCWRPDHEAVSVETVIGTLLRNADVAREVVRTAAVAGDRLAERNCSCAHALDFAVMTAPESISAEARERVALLLGERFRSSI